jgi:hypothetical protein
MLKAHLDAVETQILATSQIPANAGHALHRGTPRETFIRQFLEGHLSTRAAIGTGEIIDAQSQPRQPRNQYDVVVYRSDYPKIDLGGGISAFLVESVIATIEVKSLLTEPELEAAIQGASNAKRLTRNLVSSFHSGYLPPGILSFVVAYSGPAQIATVHGWLSRIEARHNLNRNPLPPNLDARLGILSESLEGIFCLGLGSIVFDNSPISLVTDQARQQNSAAKWTITSGNSGNLLWPFLILTTAVAGVSSQWANLLFYLQRVRIPNPQFLP